MLKNFDGRDFIVILIDLGNKLSKKKKKKLTNLKNLECLPKGLIYKFP
jgi:hypothetical protein